MCIALYLPILLNRTVDYSRMLFMFKAGVLFAEEPLDTKTRRQRDNAPIGLLCWFKNWHSGSVWQTLAV